MLITSNILSVCTVFYGLMYIIGHCDAKSVFITFHEIKILLWTVNQYLYAALKRFMLIIFYYFSRQFGYVRFFKLITEQALFYFRDVKQMRSELYQLAGVVRYVFDAPLFFWLVQIVARQNARRPFNVGQRRQYLVGHHGDIFVFHSVQIFRPADISYYFQNFASFLAQRNLNNLIKHLLSKSVLKRKGQLFSVFHGRKNSP